MAHLAAVIPQKGGPLVVQSRPTPDPGQNELLIEVKAIAVNPVDYYQRDMGMPPVPIYPAIVGSDIAGIVVKAGPNVPDSAPKPGTRVTAFASSFYKAGAPDYGSFQKFVLANSEGVVPLPDTISFDKGAVFPLAVMTALSGWTTIGISLDTKYTPEQKQAVLLWGGATSVGTFAIQSAKQLGFTIYTTASQKHHEYLKSLGADRTFDYKTDDVVSQIVTAAQQDGVSLKTAQCLSPGTLQPILDVLKETKGEGLAKVAHAPPLLPGAPSLEGVEVTFVLPPMEESDRAQHTHRVFQGWLKEGIAEGTVVSSPHVQVQEGGLEGLNLALDTLKQGVSGTKIVVRV
ncbi:chaperonin 10-like protein [Aspergillus cavernicola]|uniref:Chaperonin 10-like protein n=1 Tax=Aspergillus cavernicola TaxID=176166 RepID=A0ABR4HB15_9EURO